jgi:hypothetical protein
MCSELTHQNGRLRRALRGGGSRKDLSRVLQQGSDIVGAMPGQEAIDATLSSERAVRATIVKEWNEFWAADKASCIRPDGYLPSYAEWVTCLELRRDVRKLLQSNNS